MCEHQFKLLHTDTFSRKLSATQTKLTKIEILYCELCNANDEKREVITLTEGATQGLPEWTKQNHKQIFNICQR